MSLKYLRLSAAALCLGLAGCGAGKGKWPDLAAPLPDASGPSRVETSWPVPPAHEPVETAPAKSPEEIMRAAAQARATLAAEWSAYLAAKVKLDKANDPNLFFDAQQVLSRVARAAGRLDELADAALDVNDSVQAEKLMNASAIEQAKLKAARDLLAKYAPQ